MKRYINQFWQRIRAENTRICKTAGRCRKTNAQFSCTLVSALNGHERPASVYSEKTAFVTSSQVSPRNDGWEASAKISYWCRVNTQIWVVLLIGWSKFPKSQAVRPIRSTTQFWVVTRHQYGISALVSQTSFRGETSGGVVEYRLFSQATVYKVIRVF